ncbi:hypothetical protein TKK_0004465 [Trichogramma kaykai]|uniref:Ig-like domain-containing protein n=1 Tax=Trichogramma kaykai TaxID=54128 RepID=A0ABD2XML5_9HYME
MDNPDTVKILRFIDKLSRHKMLFNMFFAVLCISVCLRGVVEASVSVTEVHAGNLAELPCLSSDDNHRFMFWQVTDDVIIGPGNALDESKYNYEVLTGKLLIKGVSTAEAGFYKCVARGIEDNSAIKIHVVELIVRNPQSLKASSFETNLLLGLFVVMILFVGIAITLLVIMMKKRRSQNVFGVMEESRENSPAKYIPNISAPLGPSRSLESTGGIDNMGLEVDFSKAFPPSSKSPNLPL